MLKRICKSKILFLKAQKSPKVGRFRNSSLPSRMQAWCLYKYGANNRPILDEIDVPSSLKPNEVLVKIKAASINPIDALMTNGFASVALNGLRKMNKSEEFPVILGRDFSGVVVKTGAQVTRVKENDEVWGTPAVWRRGAFAEYCCVGQDELALKPKCLSHVEAASFPYVHSTMWSALCDDGGLTEQNAKNKRVFIVGGSGGVGNVGIQVMKAWGAQVTASCSTDAVDLVKRLGADDVIDYKTEDVTRRIQVAPRYDVILDSVGGNLDKFSDKRRTCNKSTYITLMPPMLDYINDSGWVLGSLRSAGDFLSTSLKQRLSSNIIFKWGYFRPNANALNLLAMLVSDGKVVPVIDSRFTFLDLPKAFEKIDTGHLRGKIVVDFETASSSGLSVQ